MRSRMRSTWRASRERNSLSSISRRAVPGGGPTSKEQAAGVEDLRAHYAFEGDVEYALRAGNEATEILEVRR